MRSEAVEHPGKARLVFFAIAKEQPMEEDNEFVVKLLCVEDLDSRTSLSQPRENSANGQAKAQTLVQAAQALIQSLFESDVFGGFYKGLFNSYVGRVCGFVLRSKSMRESRRTKLERFRDRSA